MRPTTANLKIEIKRIEEHANNSLEAWTIIGQTKKYEDEMAKARKLRRALEIKGIASRQYFLSR